MADNFMQLGQAVIGHQWVHVVLDVVIHVPVYEPADRIHVYRTAVQAVVDDIVGQTPMLQNAGHDVMPGAVQPWQTDDHEWENRLQDNRARDSQQVNRKPDSRDSNHLWMVNRW